MNLRSSAIVMKNLPATAWGDALLISREEARRIGYELEQAAERIEAVEARATPALPNVERKCSECGNGEPDLSLYCVRCLNNDGWHQAPEGMAIVPQELPQGVEEWIAKCERFAMIENNVLAFSMANYIRAYLSGMAIVPVEFIQVLQDAPEINPSNYDHDQVCRLNTAVNEALSMLTVAKEKQS